MRLPVLHLSALLLASALLVLTAEGQTDEVLHQVEGRVQYKAAGVANVRVRLIRQPEMKPVAETFTRPDGQFLFTRMREGEYLVETFATDRFEASSTEVKVNPLPSSRSIIVFVLVDLTPKEAPRQTPPGVLDADVDLQVPKEAARHYRAGLKALAAGDAPRALAEWRAAISAHPNYYAARLALGRELRLQKRYGEAVEPLRGLSALAPQRAEARVEYGAVLLALGRNEEALGELRAALQLREDDWTPHLYLGWALQETDEAEASHHFARALELNEQKAARAHLALARIANARGQRQLARQHLDAYLALVPDASDAAAVRQLADSLRP